MKEPSMSRMPVVEYDYRKRTQNIIIYQAYVNNFDCDYCPHCDKKTCTGQCLNEYAEEGYGDQPVIPNTPLHKMTLQSLLDMLPEGISPADVKIELIDDDWSGVPFAKVAFSYKKTFPANMEQFKKDKAAYDAEWAEYEKKKAAYDQWVKRQQIKKLEGELAQLKK